MADYTEIEGKLLVARPRAVLVCIDNIDGDEACQGDEIWFPRATIEDEADGAEEGEEVCLNVADWFLKQEGYME